MSCFVHGSFYIYNLYKFVLNYRSIFFPFYSLLVVTILEFHPTRLKLRHKFINEMYCKFLTSNRKLVTNKNKILLCSSSSIASLPCISVRGQSWKGSTVRPCTQAMPISICLSAYWYIYFYTGPHHTANNLA